MCCLSLCVSVCLSVYITVCLSFWLFVPKFYLPFFLSLCHIRPVFYLFIYLICFIFCFSCELFFACFSDCVSILHPPQTAFCLFLNVCFKCMFVFVPPHVPVHLCLCISFFVSVLVSVCSTRRCLHNVPSSSLCDFAERGPGSGCHPLPPSQHCPGAPDQRHPAAHRLPSLPHQPAPHLHCPAVWGAGTHLRKHRALLPGVQRADGSLQGIWVRWIHEEGLCFTGPFWAAGPTAGMLKHLLKYDPVMFDYSVLLLRTERCSSRGSCFFEASLSSKDSLQLSLV